MPSLGAPRSRRPGLPSVPIRFVGAHLRVWVVLGPVAVVDVKVAVQESLRVMVVRPEVIHSVDWLGVEAVSVR